MLSRHDLSNPLLEAEYMRIQKEVGNIVAKSMTLGLNNCDGWTNAVGKGVINFIITTPKHFFIMPYTLKLKEKLVNFCINCIANCNFGIIIINFGI